MAGGEAPTETWESLGRDPGWRWVAVPDPGLNGLSAPSQFSVRRRVGDVKGAFGVASRFRCAPPLTSPTRRQDRLCARERVPVNRYRSCACLAWVRRLPVFGWGLVPGSLAVVGLGSAAGGFGCGSVGLAASLLGPAV